MTLNTGWIFSDLEPYRGDGESTYSFYRADTLPALPTHLFGNGYQWLPTQLPDPQDEDDERYFMTPIDAAPIPTEWDVPESFRDFMSRPDLQASMPSNTSCWWTLSQEPIPSPVGDGARMVNFLNDQQCCVYWYLYLWPDGQHGVVAGGLDYSEPVEPDTARQDLVLVAPDFEQFLYRFWVENVAWFESVGEEREWDELSPPVRDYLAHYR